MKGVPAVVSVNSGKAGGIRDMMERAFRGGREIAS